MKMITFGELQTTKDKSDVVYSKELSSSSVQEAEENHETRQTE
jgi:hypothetical protein